MAKKTDKKEKKAADCKPTGKHYENLEELIEGTGTSKKNIKQFEAGT